MTTGEKVLDAMRSGEWLRTQWIARVAFDLGATPGPHPEHYRVTRSVLRALEAKGQVEHRRVESFRQGVAFGLDVTTRTPRSEWRVAR